WGKVGWGGVAVKVYYGGGRRTEFEKTGEDTIMHNPPLWPKPTTRGKRGPPAPRDRRLRLEGGGNLHRAAIETGVKRYIVQSTGFFYGRGQGLASEKDPLAHDASPDVAGSVATYTEIENRVFGSPGVEGIALRYGFFYGPGTYHDPENGSISEQVRQGQYPVIDPATGVFSFIHVEDAAAATVATLEIRPGVYN